MSSKELRQYIKNQVEKGAPKEEIVKSLMKEGWTIDDINNCLTETERPNTIYNDIQKNNASNKLSVWDNPLDWVNLLKNKWYIKFPIYKKAGLYGLITFTVLAITFLTVSFATYRHWGDIALSLGIAVWAGLSIMVWVVLTSPPRSILRSIFLPFSFSITMAFAILLALLFLPTNTCSGEGCMGLAFAFIIFLAGLILSLIITIILAVSLFRHTRKQRRNTPDNIS